MPSGASDCLLFSSLCRLHAWWCCLGLSQVQYATMQQMSNNPSHHRRSSLAKRQCCQPPPQLLTSAQALKWPGNLFLHKAAVHCPQTMTPASWSSSRVRLEGAAQAIRFLPIGQAARLADLLSASWLEDLLQRITKSRARAAVLKGAAPQHQQRVPSMVELRLQV